MTFEKRRGKSLVWSPFNKDVGLENYVSFLRYIKSNPRNTFMIKSHSLFVNIELVMHTIYPISMRSIYILKIHIFNQP